MTGPPADDLADRPAEFSTLAHLALVRATLEPTHAFRAQDKAEWAVWRRALADRLVDLLGGFPGERVPLAPEVTDWIDEGAYVRERVVFTSEPGVRVPAWLLVPHAIPPGRPVAGLLCLHGHGRGKDDVVGIAASPKDRRRLRALHYDYARRFAARGYVVLAPDARAFGERGRDGMGCGWAMAASLLLGRTLVGGRVWDAMRAVDYLQSRPEVDPARIGCVGFSWGGTHTMWTAALDERIATAVISGAFGTFGETLIEADECPCQYVPGVLWVADLPDLVAAIVPRPLLIEQGRDDPLASPATMRTAQARVRDAYDLLGAGERLALDRFAGGHRFGGGQAFAWIDRWLAMGAAPAGRDTLGGVA